MPPRTRSAFRRPPRMVRLLVRQLLPAPSPASLLQENCLSSTPGVLLPRPSERLLGPQHGWGPEVPSESTSPCHLQIPQRPGTLISPQEAGHSLNEAKTQCWSAADMCGTRDQGPTSGRGLGSRGGQPDWAAGPAFAGPVHQPASGPFSPSKLPLHTLGLEGGLSVLEGPLAEAPSI